MLEDVNIGSIRISSGRWLCSLYDDLHAVRHRGLFLQVEGLREVGIFVLAGKLVEVVKHGDGDLEWVMHDGISKLLEFGGAGIEMTNR